MNTLVQRALILVVAVLGVPVVHAGPGTAAGATREVEITASGVRPAELTVAPGTTVTWRNTDGDRHRMRSRGGPAEFDTGDIEPGATASVTLASEGDYAYADERTDDPRFGGTITVSSSAGGSGAGSAEGGSGEAGSEAPSTAAVSIANRAFSPASVTVAAGGTVAWRNADDRAHTVTARDGSFDSGTLGTGATWSRTFDAPGSYQYICLLHPDMLGTVTVAGGSGAAPSGGGRTTTTTTTAPPAAQTAPGGASGAAAGPSETHEVGIVDFAFEPSHVTVAPGDRVVWRNGGTAPHTVTGDGFDSGMLRAGATFSVTFPGAGTFSYVCDFHPEMRGTVEVVGGSGAGPAPLPSGSSGGSADLPAGTVEGAPTAVIRVVDYGFEPPELSVESRTAVTWTFAGDAPHTVTADDGTFDSGIVASGGTFTHTFDEPGTYAYACLVHPEMRGTVEVARGAGGAEVARETGAAGEPEAADPGESGRDGAGALLPLALGGATAVGAGGGWVALRRRRRT